MLLFFILVIVILALLSVGTAIVSWAHSFWRRLFKNRMRRTANIKVGAEVTSVTPAIHKADGMFAYITADVIIDFSDGSYYCTSIGNTKPYRTHWHRRGTQLSYGEGDIRLALYDAIEAHEKLARENLESVRKNNRQDDV